MTDATPALSPFAAGAPALAALGFTAIPALPFDYASHAGRGKCPGEYRSGGYSGMSKWQRFRDTSPSTFELGIWSKAPGLNIGVVLGTSVGRDLHVCCLDFDAKDPDALDALLRAAPASPMVKRGLTGETRFFVAAKSIKSKAYSDTREVDAEGKVVAKRLLDLLTGFDTRFSVVPPSIHPETGRPYVWTAGPVRADELPILTAEDIEALEEVLEGCGWSRDGQAGRERKPYTPPADGSLSEDPLEEIKRAALAHLDAWVPDLSQIAGLRRARGGWEAVDLSRSSSSGRADHERKRNLSMQAAGIRDFGTNEGFSAIDLVMRQEGLSVGEAASWLEDRLFPSDVVVDIESLAASCAEKKNPAPTAPRALGEIEAGPVVDATEKAAAAEMHTPAAIATHGAESLSELPDHLTRCPGLLGHMVDWITDTSRKPQRVLALAHALSVLGTIAGRKFSGPTDSATHLFFLCLARTGAGKGAPKKAVGQLLTAAGLRPLLGPGSFQSSSALIQHVSRTPASLCILDEFGIFMMKLNARNNSTHERQISGELRQFWSLSFEEYVPPKWAASTTRQELAPILSPALSVVGLSTPDEMYAALQGSDIVSGFINRWLVLATDTNPADTDPRASVFDPPADLVAGLKTLAEAGGTLANATMHSMQADKPMFRVGWECPEAHAVFKALASEMADQTENEALTQRTAEIAVRLATIRAIGVSGENAAVSVDDMTWGAAVARWSTARLIADVDAHLVESDHQRRAKGILRIIRDHPEPVMSRTALCRKLNNSLRSREIDEALQGLIEAAQVEKVAMNKSTPGTAGRPGFGYRAL